MYLDSFSLSATVDELLDTIVGGRIQDSVAIDEHSIGLEIYAGHRRRYLLLSAHSQAPRVHLINEKLRRGLQKPTQLGLLLRSTAEGGIIAHVSQPEWERVLIMDVDGPDGTVQLIAELMERRSNLLLVKDGIIQDCVRRVGARENRVRVSLPNRPYMPPPAQTGKINPFLLIQEDLELLFEQQEDQKRKAHQALSGSILGISPLLAREIVFRASGKGDVGAADIQIDRIFTVLQEIIHPLKQRRWTPGIADDGLGSRAFSVYPLTCVANWREIDSISAALAWYYEKTTSPDAYNAAKEPLRESLHAAKAKLSAKAASLQRSLTDDSEREILRQSGELILAYQHTIAPEQAELRAVYGADAPEIVISLNPLLTPLENAQRYFERYGKAKRALEDVPALLDETQNEIAFIDQLGADLELAANWSDIDEVQQALQSSGYWKGKRVPRVGGGKSAPLRVAVEDGFLIWVGRNSRQNEQVTFEKASPPDLWLHARGVPGAHVIIKFDGRPIPESVIQRAASLAAYYSTKQHESRVDVDVTERRYVRKIKGGAQGMVTYQREKTISVQPQSEKHPPLH